jgi:two-component system, OmpR family, phosphate regulon sensor histidine kinase PhoR
MSRRRIIIIAVITVLWGLGIAMVFLPNVRAGHGLSLYTVIGAPLLTAIAVVFSYGVGRRTRQGLMDTARQMNDMVASGEVTRLDDSGKGEIGELQRALNNLVQFTRKDLEARTLALREEQIRTRVFEADKQHMEAVLNSIAEAVLVTNAFGDVTLVNGAAEKSLHFKFDPDRRPALDEICDEPALLAALDQLRRSEHRSPRKIVELTRGSNGDTRIYEATINAVRAMVADKEELLSVVTVLHDVTREREAARLKSDFVSKVTHELRTPLSSIRAYVEMLVDGEAEDAETREEFYKIIDSESDRLSRMIDNMLNISRIEAGVIKVQKEDIALTGILKEVVECLRPQAAEKDQVLEAELSPVFYQVHADRDMLYQAILNVVSNAIKYTPAGGTIGVSSDIESGMAVVRITDSGMGIPKEDLSRLFDKFYRVGVNKKAAKGTGLGLALVKEITETLHHGQVNVESEVGRGTTFELRFPIAE